MHEMLLIDDESNGIRDILQANSIYTLFGILSMSFEDIEDTECKVNNRRQTLNIAATNRLNILKSASNDKFTDFLIYYQEIEYNVGVHSKLILSHAYPT